MSPSIPISLSRTAQHQTVHVAAGEQTVPWGAFIEGPSRRVATLTGRRFMGIGSRRRI